jgi:hypothetical protein
MIFTLRSQTCFEETKATELEVNPELSHAILGLLDRVPHIEVTHLCTTSHDSTCHVLHGDPKGVVAY